MRLGSLSERTWLALWAVVAALAIGARLGGYPLLDADEGRNAEVGREMAATHDYVMPHLDGLPYLDKPVVYFAAEAGAMQIFGPTEFAARLPAWIFTILTALIIAGFAARSGIDSAGSAVIFLSLPLTIAFARTVIFDSALSLFITVAMIAFYLAVETFHPTAGHLYPANVEALDSSKQKGGGRRPGDGFWAAIAWLSMGLGVITKGPVAIAVPLIVAVPYAIWRGKIRALWSATGLLLFVFAVGPWVWAISHAVPDFLRYVLVTETAQRLTTTALKRTGPPWYFIPYLIGGAFPWCVALIGGKRQQPSAAGATEDGVARQVWLDRYLILWMLIPFVFFSLSESKRPQYILPLMPAVALLVARHWRSGVAAIVLTMFGALLALGAPLMKLRDEFGGPARSLALLLGVAALFCGIAAWLRPKIALIALSIPTLLIPIAANPLMNAVAIRRSTKSFVRALPAGEVIGIRAFTGSMAFYLQRPIILVSPDGEELTSNYIVRHYSQFAADPAGTLKPMPWLRQALVPGRVFIVRNDDRAIRAMVEGRGARPAVSSAHFVAYTMPR